MPLRYLEALVALQERKLTRSAGHSGVPCHAVWSVGLVLVWWTRVDLCEVLRGFDGKGASKLHTVCFYLQAQELGEEEKDQSKASIEEEQSKRTKAAERYGTTSQS